MKTATIGIALVAVLALPIALAADWALETESRRDESAVAVTASDNGSDILRDMQLSPAL